MSDPGAAISQDRLCTLHDLPFLAHPRRMSRNPIDLTGIEDTVYAIDDTIAPGSGAVFLGLFVTRTAGLGKLPEFNLGTFFAPADLPAIFLSLPKGEPTRVLIAIAHANNHQMDCITAAIGLPRSRIERHFEGPRLPGLLPRCSSPFEGSNNGVRDFLAEIPFDWRTRPVHRGSLHSKSGSGKSSSKPDPSRFSPPNGSSRSGTVSRLLSLALIRDAGWVGSESRGLSDILRFSFLSSLPKRCARPALNRAGAGESVALLLFLNDPGVCLVGHLGNHEQVVSGE